MNEVGQVVDGIESGSRVKREAPVNERGRAFDPDASKSERSFAVYMHLSLLLQLVLSFLALIVPYMMWSSKREGSPFLDDHGREAMNFQISIVIWTIVFVVAAAPVAYFTDTVALLVILFPHVLGIVGMCSAASAANRGEFYRYPMAIRMLK